MPTQIHYHVRWSGKPLDWEGFATMEKAAAHAAQMVLSDETFDIQKFDGDCVRCRRPTEDSLYEILAATIKEGKAQFGTMQLFDKETGTLRIVAYQGFSREFADFFKVINGEATSCLAALKRKAPVVVNDVRTDPVFSGKDVLAVMQEGDVRSCQSIPLTTSAGHLVGILSVYYRTAHMPSIHEFESAHIQDIADHLDQVARRNR